MKIIIWNECYFAGGADWSLIDLISAWPNNNDLFIIYVNGTHEGLELIRTKTRDRAIIHLFESPLETVNKFSDESTSRPLRLIFWLYALIRAAITYTLHVPMTGQSAILMNNGGFPGGISNYIIAIIATLKGVRTKVMIVRNYPLANYSKSFLSYAVRHICNITITRIVAVSESLKLALILEGRISSQLVERIHNGVTISNKSANDKDQVQAFPKGVGGTVGIIGTLEERKGHTTLIHAWAQVVKYIPDGKLWIVGSSNSGDKNKLQTLVEDLGLSSSIVWVEFVQNIESIYSNLDLVVMPSMSFESFGRVVVESMAFEKVIVATRVGGIPELIDDGVDGFLFNAGDIEHLKDLIIVVLTDNLLRERVARNGVMKYKTLFRSDKMAEKYHSLLQE